MKMLSQRRASGHALLLLAACSAITASGCGRGTGTISGTVKFRGELLPIGDIAFLSQEADHQVRHADIIDGKYTVPAMPAGVCKVVVTTWQPTPPRNRRGPAPSEAPPAPVVKAILIPKDYGDPEKSGLTCEVKAGKQTKDFDLEP